MAVQCVNGDGRGSPLAFAFRESRLRRPSGASEIHSSFREEGRMAHHHHLAELHITLAPLRRLLPT